MDMPPVDPINPQQTDAAAGSVYTGERRSMIRWTPKWGDKLTWIEGLIVLAVLVVTAVIVAFWFVS